MPRRPKVNYNAKRKAYMCQINGQQRTLQAAPADDFPDGPNYKAAVARFGQLVATQGRPASEKDSQALVAILDARLVWLRDHRAPKTFDNHRRFLAPFSERFGMCPVRDLTPLEVDKYVSIQPWGNTTRSIFLGMLRSAFNWAVRKKLLTQNPVSDGVEKYTPQSRTKNALMPPEVHQGILKYLEDRNFTHFGRLVRFWRHTGCRPFEASCLLVSDFQPAARRCVIPYERMPRSKRSKSREKDRIIYLDSEAFSLVQTSCEGRGPEERIFTMPNGKPWYKDTIGNKWGDVRRKVKFPKGIMPYSYRHSWITDALTSGIPAAIVAEFCGTSIAMIDKTYGHLDARPEKMLEILALIERK